MKLIFVYCLLYPIMLLNSLIISGSLFKKIEHLRYSIFTSWLSKNKENFIILFSVCRILLVFLYCCMG